VATGTEWKVPDIWTDEGILDKWRRYKSHNFVATGTEWKVLSKSRQVSISPTFFEHLFLRKDPKSAKGHCTDDLVKSTTDFNFTYISRAIKDLWVAFSVLSVFKYFLVIRNFRVNWL